MTTEMASPRRSISTSCIALTGNSVRTLITGCFRHRARWNRVESRIEMHLERTRDQCVNIPAAQLTVQFAAFETIHTENSYKFTPSTLSALLDDAGFTIDKSWTDPLEWYTLTLAGIQ